MENPSGRASVFLRRLRGIRLEGGATLSSVFGNRKQSPVFERAAVTWVSPILSLAVDRFRFLGLMP